MQVKFEQEIKTRIVHKAKSVRDEPVCLKNNLKHFALNNSLAISQQNFERAMERIGVNTEQTIDYDTIFRLYERNDRGELIIHTFVN
jgi:Ca2+-binding EF-hand superfamily protein